MTQIRYTTVDGKTEITVMGHCNAGRINGFDLCCCAVSMLTFTLMDALSKLDLKSFKSSYGGGWCYITFLDSSKLADKAKTVIETVMTGYEMLEKSYPSNVSVEKN